VRANDFLKALLAGRFSSRPFEVRLPNAETHQAIEQAPKGKIRRFRSLVRVVARTNRFKKDYKLAVKRRKNIRKLLQIVERLTKGENLESKFRDHAREVEHQDCRECHIESDWLLI